LRKSRDPEKTLKNKKGALAMVEGKQRSMRKDREKEQIRRDKAKCNRLINGRPGSGKFD
jgi:hypothetical protein